MFKKIFKFTSNYLNLFILIIKMDHLTDEEKARRYDAMVASHGGYNGRRGGYNGRRAGNRGWNNSSNRDWNNGRALFFQSDYGENFAYQPPTPPIQMKSN